MSKVFIASFKNKELVVSAHREMGTDWATKMINDINSLDIKDAPVVKKFKRGLTTTFVDDGTGTYTCSICGNRSGNHLYATQRCPNK